MTVRKVKPRKATGMVLNAPNPACCRTRNTEKMCDDCRQLVEDGYRVVANKATPMTRNQKLVEDEHLHNAPPSPSYVGNSCGPANTSSKKRKPQNRS